MEDNNLRHIREEARAFVYTKRQTDRKTHTDRNRIGLGEEQQQLDGTVKQISEKELTTITNAIKQKRHGTYGELFALSTAFLQSSKNISQFVRIVGGINIIVRELTGNDSELQLLAAECLCNMTLGDAASCEKVARLAGTYLLAFVENPINRMSQETCLWAIQNILATGGNGTKVLKSQGISETVLNSLLQAKDTVIVRELAITLELLVDCGLLDASKQFDRIMETLQTAPYSLEVLRLFYKILIQHASEPCLSSVLVNQTVLQVVNMLATTLANGGVGDNASEAILCIRILEIFARGSVDQAEQLLSFARNANLQFSALFNAFSAKQMMNACDELLCLLGKIFSHDIPAVNEYLLGDDFINKLAIPVPLLA